MTRLLCRLLVLAGLCAGFAGCAAGPNMQEDRQEDLQSSPISTRDTLTEAPPTAHFEKVVLDSTTTRPNELAVAPDGRVFYIEREGAIKVWQPDTESTEMVGFIPVTATHTNGLLGLTLDPAFEENRWIYLYYSPRGDDTRNVLARYTLADGQIQPSSRRVILEVPFERHVGGGAHSGGSLAFGPDGALYLSTGDNTNPEEVELSTPIDERPGREHWDAQRSAGNTNDLRGKILRVRPLPEGGYEIPEGNLFPYGAAGRPEIFVMGNRNPFRIAVDPQTGWLFWGDYGPSAPGSEKRGAEGFDEFNLAREAGNYGWPYFVADNKPFRKYDFAADTSGRYFDPEAPINDSPNNTGAELLPPAQPALIWYPGGPSEEFPELGAGGRGPMGGAVYRYDEAEVGPHGLPAYYDGSFFIMEFMRHWLMDVRIDEDGALEEIDPFLAEMNFRRPFDMDIGPDGRIYLIEWGTNYEGWFNDNGRIVRLDYHGTENRPPLAAARADTTSGAVPLTVQFAGENTRADDKEEEVEYAWDFDGDGTIDATGPAPRHTYTDPGTYRAALTVTGSEGMSGQADLTITAGNTAPEVTVDWPLEGGVIDLDRPVDFRVAVRDREEEISPEKIRVYPYRAHDSHRHRLESHRGWEGSFEIPSAARHMFLENHYASLEVSYTDEGGPDAPSLTTEREVILQPRRKDAVHVQTIRGADRVIEGDYRNRVGVETFLDATDGDYVSYGPVNFRGIEAITFRVASGTGGTIEARLGDPEGKLLGKIAVEALSASTEEDDSRRWQKVTMPVTDPGGPQELYLVFRGSEADQNQLMRLDWLEFEGPGMMNSGG